VRIFDIQRPIERLAPLGADQTPNVDRRCEVIDFADERALAAPPDHFVTEISGYLRIENPGRHEFELLSDDGARLIIDETVVAEHDGCHAPSATRGVIELSAGLHRLALRHFENDGGTVLSLRWRTPGAAAGQPLVVVPASAFRIEQGVTRVVSPGRKVLLDGREHLRPGDGMPLEGVHPGWIVEDLRPEGFEPQVGGMAFLPDGRLVLSSFRPVNNGVLRTEPNGTLWILEGVVAATSPSATPTTRPTARQIADGFHDPLGVEVVDGEIYVAQRREITRLADRDGDGEFEFREVFASGWVSDNYHHFTFGLEHVDDGTDRWLHGTLSTSIYFDNTMTIDGVVGDVVSMNGPNPAHRGSCFRVNMATRQIEYLAGGFRTPNGIGRGPRGELFVTDNQGAWLPASKLVNVRQGRFFGHTNGAVGQRSDRYPEGGFLNDFGDQPVSPPTLWLPQNECANSPGEPLLIRSGPFAGQLYIAELTMGGIRRAFLEEIDGEWQGAVFQFTQGLECGVNRLIEGPDGCLYAGGTGADGNWNWRNTRFGLQRLRPRPHSHPDAPHEGTAFEYHSISATPEGFEIRFTRSIDLSWLSSPGNYTIVQWHYVPTPQYGGPKHDEKVLPVARAVPIIQSSDPPDTASVVRITVPGLRPGSVVRLRVDPVTADGEGFWATEAWYTLNRVPKG